MAHTPTPTHEPLVSFQKLASIPQQLRHAPCTDVGDGRKRFEVPVTLNAAELEILHCALQRSPETYQRPYPYPQCEATSGGVALEFTTAQYTAPIHTLQQGLNHIRQQLLTAHEVGGAWLMDDARIHLRLPEQIRRAISAQLRDEAAQQQR
ncbi:MAG: hypothetical protein DI582_06370 [Azospirillum brasilense]|nr:MAG: hypothetical protein DI582_06370 [Azospirillum brasilense]